MNRKRRSEAVKQSKKTFREVVQNVEISNRIAIVTRARMANRLAKGSLGRSRRNAYAVKVKTLKALMHKFDGDVELRDDPATPGMMLIVLSAERFGLHAPRRLFENIA
jgi:hypothetical protein